MGTEEQELIEK